VALRVALGDRPADAGIVVRAELVEEHALRAVRETVITVEGVPLEHASQVGSLGGLRMIWLTPANPYLSPEQRERLGPDGVLPVGTIVRGGEVLASAIIAARSVSKGPASPGMAWVTNCSTDVPLDWHGARVVDIDDGSPRKIKLRAEDRLTTG